MCGSCTGEPYDILAYFDDSNSFNMWMTSIVSIGNPPSLRRFEDAKPRNGMCVSVCLSVRLSDCLYVHAHHGRVKLEPKSRFTKSALQTYVCIQVARQTQAFLRVRVSQAVHACDLLVHVTNHAFFCVSQKQLLLVHPTSIFFSHLIACFCAL